jgi:hypothetical protein
LRFLPANLDALATLCAGIVATLWAWCWTEVATREVETPGRPERAIGPLLILYALLRLAAAG